MIFAYTPCVTNDFNQIKYNLHLPHSLCQHITLFDLFIFIVLLLKFVKENVIISTCFKIKFKGCENMKLYGKVKKERKYVPAVYYNFTERCWY